MRKLKTPEEIIKDAGYDKLFWNEIAYHKLIIAAQRDALEYFLKINRMDTKTAEEKEYEKLAVSSREFAIGKDQNGDYESGYYNACIEQVSPLKKRIEELEDALYKAKNVVEREGYKTFSEVLERILNPSTNGKQD